MAIFLATFFACFMLFKGCEAGRVDNPALRLAMCNRTELEGFLSQDSVCSDAFYEVNGDAAFDISMENASITIQNLCGDRCGELFYNAVSQSCVNSSDILQIYCSRFINQEGMTVYCSYLESLPEFRLASGNIRGFCLPVSSQCSQECSLVVENVVEAFGCCLPERYSDPSGIALRDDDDYVDFFREERVYSSCGVQRPTTGCDSPFQNGRPVFTVNPPASPSPSSTTDASAAALDAKAPRLGCFFIIVIGIVAKL